MTFLRPADSRQSLRAGAFSLLLFLALLFLFSPQVSAQSSGKLVLEIDKTKPGRKPEEVLPGTTKSKAAGRKQSSPLRTDAQGEATTAESSQVAAALQDCDLSVLLKMDDTRIAFVNLYNHPENSDIPVTITQTTAGIVGYSLSPAGPFTPTLNIIIHTDGAGNGQSADIYIQGLTVGGTTTYGQSPYGFTNSINFTVLPQCNCPPVPVVP